MRMRWFFDVFKVKESSFLNSQAPKTTWAQGARCARSGTNGQAVVKSLQFPWPFSQVLKTPSKYLFASKAVFNPETNLKEDLISRRLDVSNRLDDFEESQNLRICKHHKEYNFWKKIS